MGAKFPDILFDGVVNPATLVEGLPPAHLRHSIRNNGAATYANFNLAMMSENIQSGEFRVDRDLVAMNHRLDPLKAVELAPHDPPGFGRRRRKSIARLPESSLSTVCSKAPVPRWNPPRESFRMT